MRGCLIKTVELACRAGLFYLPYSLKKAVSLSKPYDTGNINELKDNILVNGESLTRREMEILQLMVKNYSNRQIAQKLFISEPTVKNHVSNILRKLGQSNRAGAVVYSYKMGLIKESKAVLKLVLIPKINQIILQYEEKL